MRVFLDTSSLVKLYHSETGSAELKAQLTGHVGIVVTQLTWVESTSAFARIVRRGSATPNEAATALSRLRAEWTYFEAVQLDEAIYQQAAQLVQKHTDLALRSLDAIQLACALAAGPLDAFFTHDQRLRAAALAEGLPVR